ncbi:MAG: GAK system XXXCH domain-containing protein [Candidatus Eisenbacteria bacterium]|nr:GAK system XXXCH domain-containing protein [Candidatus Eisenbacteria bacterium]
MGSKEIRLDQQMTLDEAVDFLRRLADGLSRADAPPPGHSALDLPQGDFTKLDLRIKRAGDHVALKVKLKHEEEPAATREGAEAPGPKQKKEKYKKLKKRMQDSYDAVLRSLASNRLPDAEIVRSLIADSHAMVTYPDRGDAFYDDYIRACEGFAAAFEAGDLEQLKLRCREIHVLKERCHDKFK